MVTSTVTRSKDILWGGLYLLAATSSMAGFFLVKYTLGIINMMTLPVTVLVSEARK